MSELLTKNQEYASVLKETLMLRYEPVAIKLVKEGEDYPEGYSEPVEQMSHCQAVFRAKEGQSFKMPLASQNCLVGTSVLGMNEAADKVISGEFHLGVGMHDSAEAAAKMVADRMIVPFTAIGEVVCPLKDANFIPDVVAIADIPERIYWIVPLSTATEGGRANFSTAPFQCACEDVTAVPICTGKPNISLGCFGCRKKTSMKSDELACGIPYAMIPAFVDHLKRYSSTVMTKAKRD